MSQARHGLCGIARTAALAISLAPVPWPVFAGADASEEVQRALLSRQHQSEEFALQLKQSQSGLNVRPEERRDLDRLYLQQRQAQEQLHTEQQQQSVQGPEGNRAGAEARFERERRAQELRFESLTPRGDTSSRAPRLWSRAGHDRR
jgi:TolA-binding protein